MRASKMYKDSPTLEKDEETGRPKVSKKEEKADKVQEGMDGVKIEEKGDEHAHDMHSRHNLERHMMHSRHEHEHHQHEKHGGSKEKLHEKHAKEHHDMLKKHDKEMPGEKGEDMIKHSEEKAGKKE